VPQLVYSPWVQWATVQNNLGGALARLGERESGTVQFEEAVAAYRSALKEWARERAPLDWATSIGMQGRALVRLAERTWDAAMAETACRQIEVALETVRAGGHVPRTANYEALLREARQARDALRGIRKPKPPI